MASSIGGKSSVPDTAKPKKKYDKDEWERISRVMVIMARHATNSIVKIKHVYHITYGEILSDSTLYKTIKVVQSEDSNSSATLKDMIYRRISHAELGKLNEMIEEFEKLVLDSKNEPDTSSKYWKTLNEMYQRRQVVIEEVLLYIHEVTTVKDEQQFAPVAPDLDVKARAKAAKNNMLNPVDIPKLYPAGLAEKDNSSTVKEDTS